MNLPPFKTGIVISGGGARGAYEVGVLSYLRDELGPELGRTLPLEIICGTSVGALHACFLAAAAHLPQAQGPKMVDFWQRLSLENMLSFGYRDILSLGRELFRSPKPSRRMERNLLGLVRPVWLERELIKGMSWRQIGVNIAAGHLEALSVTAPHVGPGRSAGFIQSGRQLQSWSAEAGLDAIPTRIGTKHAMESEAVTLLVQPGTVSCRMDVAGGLRTSIPLSPALRLGAQRVLVLSVRHADPAAPAVTPLEEERNYATAPSLIGKTLNALFLDPTELDVSRLRQVNELLDAGTRAYGAGFARNLNAALPAGSQPLRHVRELEIAPSRDIGAMAAEHARAPDFLKRNPGLAGRLIRQLAERESRYEADLVSYLLFDGAFSSRLIEMGRNDARSRRAEWERFWSEAPLSDVEAAQLAPGT